MLQKTFREKVTDTLSSLQSGKTFSFLSPVIIFLVLLATIFLVNQQIHYQQYAAASGSIDYYVSPSGNDSNPGTQAAPFATIEKADSVATPGTTIHVAPGTYTMNGTYTTHSGTATARITFISDTKWGAKLASVSLGSHSGYATWYSGGDYVDIIGFDIAGGTNGTRGIAKDGSYSRIIGNKIHGIGGATCKDGGDGIVTNNYATHDDDIIGNLIFNTGPPLPNTCNQHHGIYQGNIGGHISNNIVYNIRGGYGIHCWHACSNATITNNLVFNNNAGGIIVGGGDAPNYANSPADNIIIANNIAINNARDGIREFEYSGEHTIGSHNQILNNIVYGNPDGNMVLLAGNTASGTITSNAQFVNYQQDGSGDYHLKSTSPAIDAGTPVGAPSTDFDGNPRPQGKGYDIGPYEYFCGSNRFKHFPPPSRPEQRYHYYQESLYANTHQHLVGID